MWVLLESLQRKQRIQGCSTFQSSEGRRPSRPGKYQAVKSHVLAGTMTQRSTSGKLLSVRHPTDPKPIFKGRTRKKTNAMTLYVIRAVKTGLVKVGISDSFDARLSKLRREGPDELEVLKVFHGEREYIEGLEKEIHAELKAYHSHGEWFDFHSTIIAAIIETA